MDNSPHYRVSQWYVYTTSYRRTCCSHAIQFLFFLIFFKKNLSTRMRPYGRAITSLSEAREDSRRPKLIRAVLRELCTKQVARPPPPPPSCRPFRTKEIREPPPPRPLYGPHQTALSPVPPPPPLSTPGPSSLGPVPRKYEVRLPRHALFPGTLQ